MIRARRIHGQSDLTLSTLDEQSQRIGVAVLCLLCYGSCALEARVARLLSLNHLHVKSPAFSFFAVSLA